MIRLAHLSDIHLGPLPPVRPGEMMNKRVTGFLNWQLSRRRSLRRDTLGGLVAHLKSMNPSLIAVSGDLVNLGVRAEFDMTAAWLATLGPPAQVAVIPGNHDAYVRGALDMATRAWGDYMRGQAIGSGPFPYFRRFGDLALVGCNSAVPRPFFVASGRFDIEQAKQLTSLLKILGERGLFRAVMIHHPPEQAHARDPRRGLSGAELFRHAIAEAGAELVLHGHLHKSTIGTLTGPKGDVPVLGVASASAEATRGEEPARYNLIEIERAGAGFSCSLTEYGYQRVGDGIVKRLHMRLS
ncbi:MAG: metallophosphoesterase [Alphaproteobacteria bacterium]|nr:metallophosphoesterase [Alphaproteobacteria bacterium]